MSNTEIIVKMVLDRWNASISAMDNLLQKLSDEEIQMEIAPGKNRGIYLLGHLIAVHDAMLILLDMGEEMFPELKDIFLTNPDHAVAKIPDTKELRSYWKKQCDELNVKFEQLQPEHWFAKHTAVSSEEFINEPHRNKLNIILTRTTHLQYHLGQLKLLGNRNKS